MTVGSNIPIWGLMGGIAGPLIRLIRDRLTPPQKGLRYYDLHISQAADLAHLIPDDSATASRRKPYTHFIRIMNYGREIIDENDYIRPLRVQYDDQANAAQVIGYRIIRDARTINPKIYGSASDPASIVFRETLNSGDVITLGVLLALTGNPEEPQVDCRIKGVPHLNLKWHHHSTTGSRMLRRLVVHYFALPLAIIAGLVVGWLIAQAINPNADEFRGALNYVLAQFGAGLLLGLLLGGLLAATFELWEFFSFRSQRHSVEATFRAVAREHLDKLLSLE